MQYLLLYVGGLDRFLAQSLESIVRENLGGHAIRKIEKRLFEKHGISLTESIEQFQKLDLVLREHFGRGADGIEQKLFNNVLGSNKKDAKNKKILKPNHKNQITIKNPDLVNIVLEAFGDADKKRIIVSVTEKSQIIYEILKESQIPQTSGYRKINSLIEKGILVVDGHVESSEGKKINKYRTAFNNIQIDIAKNQIALKMQIDNNKIKESSILMTMSEI